MKEPWYITIYENDDVSIDHWVGTDMFQEVDDIGASIITADKDGYELLKYCAQKYNIPYNEFNTIWRFITAIGEKFRNDRH